VPAPQVGFGLTHWWLALHVIPDGQPQVPPQPSELPQPPLQLGGQVHAPLEQMLPTGQQVPLHSTLPLPQVIVAGLHVRELSQVRVPLHGAPVSQHGWPCAPHGAQLPLLHAPLTQRPAQHGPPTLPQATQLPPWHTLASKQKGELPPSQQLMPVPPQATHVSVVGPAVEQIRFDALHAAPWQHAWP
jgi:hypothetical protein